MKKYLVLSMVLGIASLASAGLIFDVASVDVMPGEAVTVSIVQEAPNPAGAGGIITVDFSGAAGAIEGVGAQGLGSGWGWLLAGDITILGGNQAYFEAAASPGVGTPGVGSELGYPIPGTMGAYTSTVTFTFTPDASQILKIGGAWDGATSDSTMAVNVIPEPMTMALLGLGGLFLRRRK